MYIHIYSVYFEIHMYVQSVHKSLSLCPCLPHIDIHRGRYISMCHIDILPHIDIHIYVPMFIYICISLCRYVSASHREIHIYIYIGT